MSSSRPHQARHSHSQRTDSDSSLSLSLSSCDSPIEWLFSPDPRASRQRPFTAPPWTSWRAASSPANVPRIRMTGGEVHSEGGGAVVEQRKADFASSTTTTLEVPEEPIGKPEDAENRAGTPLTFFATVKIAKWMAKAYGYRAAKKQHYTSQDQILEQLKRKEAFDELTIPVPQLARRHPADEGIDGIPSREAVASAKASGGKLFAHPGTPLRSSVASTPDLSACDGSQGDENEEDLANRCVPQGVMTGDPEEDAARICSWLSAAFGVVDEEYHRAYSRECIRQARRAAKGLETIEGLASDNKEDVGPVWF